MTVLREIRERPAGAPPCARLIRIEDPSCGLAAYLALDREAEGPAFGGIRRRVYRDDDEARREVLGLARGMGLKLAFAGLETPGAKAVILDGEDLPRGALYEALGRAMAELGPIWVAGPDLGTTETDLDRLRALTPMVNARSNDPGRATARGVYRGLQAGLEALHGDPDPRRRAVLVQGLGSVGRELAWMLLDAGTQLGVSDLDRGRAEAFLAAEIERGRGAVLHANLDLASFAGAAVAPCAVGGAIDGRTARELRARLVCGSANEQLAEPGLDRILADRGRLYIPDFCVNAGAVIEGVVVHEEGEAGRSRAERLIEETRDRVAALLARAAAERRTPLEAALEVAEENRG